MASTADYAKSQDPPAAAPAEQLHSRSASPPSEKVLSSAEKPLAPAVPFPPGETPSAEKGTGSLFQAGAFQPTMKIPPRVSQKISGLMAIGTLSVVYIHARAQHPGSFGGWKAPMNPGGVLVWFVADYWARFAVPMFFSVSGFLFFVHKPDDFPQFDAWRRIHQRMTSLGQPFILWNLMAPLQHFLFTMVAAEKPIDIWSDVDHGYNKIHLIFSADSLAFHLWYVRDLFVMACLSPLMYKIFKYDDKLLLAVSAVFALIWGLDVRGTNQVIYIPPWIQLTNTTSPAFFCFGAWLALKGVNMDRQLSAGMSYFLISAWMLAGLVILTVATFFLQDSDIAMIRVDQVCRLLLFPGIFCIWFAYDHVEGWLKDVGAMPWLLWGSKYSMWVYCAHEPLMQLMAVAIEAKVGKGGFLWFLIYLGFPLVWLSFLLAIGSHLAKYNTSVFAALTGGRG